MKCMILEFFVNRVAACSVSCLIPVIAAISPCFLITLVGTFSVASLGLISHSHIPYQPHAVTFVLFSKKHTFHLKLGFGVFRISDYPFKIIIIY